MKIGFNYLNRKNKIIIATLFVILTLVIIGTVIIQSTVKPPELIEKEPTVATTETDEKEEVGDKVEKVGDIYTFLFAGRDKAGYNTDTIMVVSFNTKDYTANILSIPRDTMSANTGRSVKKINAAYGSSGEGNPDDLVKEVEQIIGVPIDKYAIINLDVFVEAVDLLGGVEIDVPQRMYYVDSTWGQELYVDLQPGVQTLNGEQAMGFVRYRSYANGDLGRVDAQQLFIEAALQTVLKPQNITKIPEMIEIIFQNLETDFTAGELIWLASEAINVDPATGINMYMLPGVDQYSYEASLGLNLSYYFINQAELLTLLNESFNPTNGEITADDLTITTQRVLAPAPAPVVEPEPEADPEASTETPSTETPSTEVPSTETPSTETPSTSTETGEDVTDGTGEEEGETTTDATDTTDTSTEESGTNETTDNTDSTDTIPEVHTPPPSVTMPETTEPEVHTPTVSENTDTVTDTSDPEA